MQYIYTIPKEMAFKDRGLFGYAFGPLQQNVDFYYIESAKGHETFMISRRITRTYYILSGEGHFTIADRKYDVTPGVLVEVPPKVEYTYSGKMTLIAFCRPSRVADNDTFTRWNPDVVPPGIPPLPDARSLWTRLARLRFLGKSPVGAYLRINQFLWDKLPPAITGLSAIRCYGAVLHKLARTQAHRKQAFNTYFLRNRPQLHLIQRLAARRTGAPPFSVAVLGCSIGAEAYSIAWAIRRTLPELALALHAVDISADAVAAGKRGVYPPAGSELPGEYIFERVTKAELDEMFDRNCDAFRVKEWIRQGIEWHVRDVRDPEERDVLGVHDLVVANNFLCHMDPSSAEACLRNIGEMVRPDGYLIVSGIDLDVRTKVANELGWRAVQELLEEIHEADPALRACWPFKYGGLEPMNKRRPDWKRRYAAAFQVPPALGSTDHRERASTFGEASEDAKVLLATDAGHASREASQPSTIVSAGQ